MREALARHMFNRRCELDGADWALVELAWIDQDVRDFWLAEADHVLEFVGLDDLSNRLSDALTSLEAIRSAFSPNQLDGLRLDGKIEGVKLVKSYLDEIRRG